MENEETNGIISCLNVITVLTVIGTITSFVIVWAAAGVAPIIDTSQSAVATATPMDSFEIMLPFIAQNDSYDAESGGQSNVTVFWLKVMLSKRGNLVTLLWTMNASDTACTTDLAAELRATIPIPDDTWKPHYNQFITSRGLLNAVDVPTRVLLDSNEGPALAFTFIGETLLQQNCGVFADQMFYLIHQEYEDEL